MKKIPKKIRVTNIHQYQLQRGFTLVEIMVAITIGLVMMAGILQVSQANKESNRLQRNLGFVQENIRSAMGILGRDIRMAGHYIDNNPEDPIPGAPGPIAPFVNVADIATINTALAITADGGDSNNDQITLTYELTLTITRDCLGQPINVIPPATANLFAVNHYFIENQRLMCRGNGGPNAQPLVDNVESLQILYGENTNNNPLSANRYVRAEQVTDMANVVSVRIGMRFISRDPVRHVTDTASYALLDAASVTPNDRFLRREITTTISLRNSLRN